MFAEAATAIRVLTFRATAEELHTLGRRHLIFGLLCTWVVGAGRWWEDPDATLVQNLGLGSVVYVFVLAVFLWLVLWPLRPAKWSFVNLLTFISLTSIPGILYAIPVRHGMAIETGQVVRLWLLAVVAGWRVLLLAFYLGRGAGLHGFRRVLAALFPLLIIVVTLSALNLDRVVFNFMGGVPATDRTVNDTAYEVLMLITLLSMYAFIPLTVIYLMLIVRGVKARSKARAEATAPLLHVNAETASEPGIEGARRTD
jgi:hypothetical protein